MPTVAPRGMKMVIFVLQGGKKKVFRDIQEYFNGESLAFETYLQGV
jgi:hypothetical protein